MVEVVVEVIRAALSSHFEIITVFLFASNRTMTQAHHNSENI
jgi:hypothetical protein